MFETKYLKIADELEARIDRGHWEGRLPGVATLSTELDANPRTISKALQTLTRKGKVTIKASCGTFVNKHHNVRPKHDTIGVIGLSQNQKKEVELTDVENIAGDNGYHVLSIEYCNEVLQKKKYDLLGQMPIDGFLFTNSTLTVDVAASLTQAGIPFVSVNRVSDIPGINWVDFNTEKGYSQIFEHFLELGHSRIAYLGYRESMEEYAHRIENIYRKVLQEAGCYDPSLYIHDGDMNDYYRRYGEQYGDIYGVEKAGYLMNMERRPTAILISELDIAHGFCRQVQQMGMQIPGNISVAAVCQHRQEAEHESFVSVLTGSTRQRARRATEILMQKLNNPASSPTQELLGMDLILRDSVGRCSNREIKNGASME